jgi:hypothetical protein
MEQVFGKDFENMEPCIGIIIEVDRFAEAHRTADRQIMNFGNLGIQRSSEPIGPLSKRLPARKPDPGGGEFSPKPMANFFSEVLTTSSCLPTGGGGIVHPERRVPHGATLS